MTAPTPACPYCREPVAPLARACPHCRNTTATIVVVTRGVDDGRTRYRLARAVVGLGPGAPALVAAQAALARPGSRLLDGALPGMASACAALLEAEGVAFSLEAATTPPGEPRRAPGVLGFRARAAGIVVAALLALVAAVLVARRDRPGLPGPRVASGTPSAAAGLATPGLSEAEIAARVLPSTVSIRCGDAVGTGFFVGPGRVLTNSHVACAGSEPLKLRRPGGEEGAATVLSRDDRLDLALLDTALAAPTVALGDAGALRVADRILVVGSPKGMEFTVSQGGVSNLDRTYLGVAMIQIDAPVNPGNSGGPLVDLGGRVVGVVSLKRADAEGIGFALPINYAFTGATPMIPGHSAGASASFQRMADRAADEERTEAASIHQRGQRPVLVTAALQPGQPALAVQILWPSAQDPGPRTFDFELSTDAASCSMRGEVRTWQKIDGEAAGAAITPQMRDWLRRNDLSSDFWVGAAAVSFADCPGEALTQGAVLKMPEADDDANTFHF